MAVCLGWRLAELYDSKVLPGPPQHAGSKGGSKGLPAHLPGFGEMSPHEKARALAAHVGADLASLGNSLGLEMPTATRVRDVLDTPGHSRDDVRGEVFELYVGIRDRLAASDVATVLGCGRGSGGWPASAVPTAR